MLLPEKGGLFHLDYAVTPKMLQVFQQLPDYPSSGKSFFLGHLGEKAVSVLPFLDGTTSVLFYLIARHSKQTIASDMRVFGLFVCFKLASMHSGKGKGKKLHQEGSKKQSNQALKCHRVRNP